MSKCITPIKLQHILETDFVYYISTCILNKYHQYTRWYIILYMAHILWYEKYKYCKIKVRWDPAFILKKIQLIRIIYYNIPIIFNLIWIHHADVAQKGNTINYGRSQMYFCHFSSENLRTRRVNNFMSIIYKH